jgi:prepilin-type N-terminal cleavage/methylation domain-containing protein
MTRQRGFTLIELLIAALLTTVVAVGLFSAYLAAARSLASSSMQAALQRQGVLAMEAIGRELQSAVESDSPRVEAYTPGGTCNGRPDAVQINTATGVVCYYAAEDGALCEFRGTACKNLLAGGLGTIVLLRQTSPPDPRCADRRMADGQLISIPPGAPCFSMRRNELSPKEVDVSFAIRDDDGDLDGVNAMSFRNTLTCSGRNC